MLDGSFWEGGERGVIVVRKYGDVVTVTVPGTAFGRFDSLKQEENFAARFRKRADRDLRYCRPSPAYY